MEVGDVLWILVELIRYRGVLFGVEFIVDIFDLEVIIELVDLWFWYFGFLKLEFYVEWVVES